MKLFRASIRKSYEEKVLVTADNKIKASLSVRNAINSGEITIDDSANGYTNIDHCELVDISINIKELKNEIKDYGVLVNGKLLYDKNIISVLMEGEKKAEREEWLKKYHLELPLEIQ